VNTFSNEISSETGDHIIPIGIVATKVRGQAPIHTNTLRQMRNKAEKAMKDTEISYPRVFHTYFPESSHVAEAAEFQSTKRTLRQKWGYDGQFTAFENFTKEFMNACGEV
jgi:chromosome partitioning protein